jgi:hypothetical protein
LAISVHPERGDGHQSGVLAWPSICHRCVRKAADVAQRSVEILIGRLVTDEAFRSAFLRDARTSLSGFIESGYELTAVEVAALCATPGDVWNAIAGRIDSRLQKVRL